MNMEPIVVSNQVEYNEALELCQDALKKNIFDIDVGVGMEIVEEVDYLVHNYLYDDATKEETEKSLSDHYFSHDQTNEIIGYFSAYRPSDLYDIERGLNALNLSADGDMNNHAALIHIKNCHGIIRVYHPVEVFGQSEIEAFSRSKIVAHDDALITAHDRSIVEALNSVQVTAYDHSHITARNNSSVVLYNQSTATAYNHTSITARDRSKITLFDAVNAEAFDFSVAEAHDESIVSGKEMAKIRAFNKATVYAYNQAQVTAKDLSYTVAGNRATIIAEDNAVVIAGDKTTVAAKHRSLVFVKDQAECDTADKALVVNSAQNKPLFLKSNILHILDHPFIDRDPSLAFNLLISASNQDDKTDFDYKLKAMGCVDPQSTERVLISLVREFEQKLIKKKDRQNSQER
jgi:hypothetical protein